MRATRLTWSPEHACSANARAGWQSVNTAWPAPHTTRSKIPVSRDPRYCPGPQTISPPAPRRLPTAQEAGCGEPRHADQVLTKGLSIKAECSQSPGGAGPLPREAHDGRVPWREVSLQVRPHGSPPQSRSTFARGRGHGAEAHGVALSSREALCQGGRGHGTGPEGPGPNSGCAAPEAAPPGLRAPPGLDLK